MPTHTNRRRKTAASAPAARTAVLPPPPPSPQMTGEQAPGGLAEEIAALREMLRQAGELSEGDLPAAALMRLLDIYSRAAARLAGLLKMQQALDGEQGTGDALSRILDEVIADIAQNKARFPNP